MAAFAVGAAPGESLESNNNHINVTERRDIQTDRQTDRHMLITISKVFPYSLPNVGPGADPGVQAVSPQVT